MSRVLVAQFALLLALPLPVMADTDWSIGLRSSVRFVDNSNFGAENERSDIIPQVGADFKIDHTAADWFLDVDYNVERRFYLRDTQRDRTRSSGTVLANWDQLPNRLRWSLSHSERQLKRDPGGGNVESNIEDRAVTSFGPTVSYAPTPVDTVSLSPSVTSANLRENDENDSLRYAAVLSWRHRLSPIDAFTLSASHVDVDVDSDDSRDDYDAVNLTAGYNVQLSDIEWLFSAGAGEVNRVGGLGFSTTSLNAQAQYRSGPHAFSVGARSFLSDTSIGDNNQRVGVLSVDDVGNLSLDFVDIETEPDIVKRKIVEMAYINESPCNRCRLAISANWQNRDFKTQNRRSIEKRLTARMTYALSEQSGVSLSYEPRTTRQEPPQGSSLPTRETSFYTYRLGYSNSWLRDTEFSTALIYETRDTIDNWELNVGIRYLVR